MPVFHELKYRKLLSAALLAASIWLPAATPSQAAEYKLQPGDSVELSIAGIPDLRHKAVLGLDGVLSLPLIGEVNAGGMSLSDLRRKVRDLFPEQVYRNRSGISGPSDVILSSEVTIEISEYRPVYIGGNVSKPGAQNFLPGMTVRQVVAVAGGYGSPEMAAQAAAMRMVEITARETSLTAVLERESARLHRLEAELGMGELDSSSVPDSGSARAQLLLKQEHDADWDAQRSALEATLKRQQQRLAYLTQRKSNGESSEGITKDELKRLQGLKKKGLVTGARLADAQRSALSSSNDLLLNDEQIAQAERDIDVSTLQLERLGHQRRSQVLAEIEEARVAVASAEANLRAARQQAQLLSPAATDGAGAVNVMITRMGEPGQNTHLAADEDTQLMPGDVVEVSVSGTSNGRVAQAD